LLTGRKRTSLSQSFSHSGIDAIHKENEIGIRDGNREISRNSVGFKSLAALKVRCRRNFEFALSKNVAKFYFNRVNLMILLLSSSRSSQHPTVQQQQPNSKSRWIIIQQLHDILTCDLDGGGSKGYCRRRRRTPSQYSSPTIYNVLIK
jgi:hypothetical protein